MADGCTWRCGRPSTASKLGLNETGPDMQVDFGALVAHLAKTRHVRAGTVVGSGPVSNQDAGKGVGNIAERRALEAAARGAPATPYLAFGDVVHLEMRGRDGHSLFGAIAQRVTGPQAAEPAPAADMDRAAETAADARQQPRRRQEPPDLR